ncbi:MAG: dual specificity protein phosphatase family protein [Anaerolineae bacterium]|jgi:dual specificity MAP kinase phosphatase|nr:dual specificity protein phosphatase family protein [Anaerolineae bacterium]
MSMEGQPPSQWNRVFSLLRTGPAALFWRFYDQGLRRLTGAPVWHLSRITPQLYVGGQHLHLSPLLREGITATVNLREAHYSDVDRGIGGPQHLHLATRDNTPPTLPDLNSGADFIAAQIAAGGKVYVHCGVGVGRAPTAAAAYLIKYHRLTPAQALARIRQVRPFIHLTRRQYGQLITFEQQVRALPPEAAPS